MPLSPERLEYERSFEESQDKKMPHLFPEGCDFRQMPHLPDTGFVAGLCERACMKTIAPWVDKVLEHPGRKLRFVVSAQHGIDTTTGGVSTSEFRCR